MTELIVRFGEETEAYSLVESVLEGVAVVNHHRDVRLELALGPLAVRKGKRLPLDARLAVVCKNYLVFTSERRPELALSPHALDSEADAQVGRKTVVGFDVEEVSGPPGHARAEKHLRRLGIVTLDAKFTVVFADLEVEVVGGTQEPEAA